MRCADRISRSAGQPLRIPCASLALRIPIMPLQGSSESAALKQTVGLYGMDIYSLHTRCGCG